MLYVQMAWPLVQRLPQQTPPKSLALSPGSSSSPSVQVLDLPVVRRPCGRGTCKVSTSNTVKNPGRKIVADSSNGVSTLLLDLNLLRVHVVPGHAV
ncbi:hypothetical protein D5086_018443 [Populus alba]|uniref:Uncharacterized protein n=1 Tax=Populus alba TaxID=43335 RepID=A0ACC4BRU3_POPAL